MIYNELLEAWKRELRADKLQDLPSDFYPRLVDYVNKLKDESRMLDKKTAKARLLRIETRSCRRMITEIVMARCRKLVSSTGKNVEASQSAQTSEERKLMKDAFSVIEAFHGVAQSVIHGRSFEADLRSGQRRPVFRFRKDVPAVIGDDLLLYGPFKAEDVASVPSSNGRILVGQMFAEGIVGN